MLTVRDSTAICDVVAKDPEASKRIASDIASLLPARWGISGGLRNAGYVALGMVTLGNYGDPSEPEFANRVCTGISDACSNAIIAAVKAKDPLLRRVKTATPVSRVLRGVDHTAVRITMIDDQNHMFDWHATLEAKNPMLHRTEALWIKGDGGITMADFTGFD